MEAVLDPRALESACRRVVWGLGTDLPSYSAIYLSVVDQHLRLQSFSGNRGVVDLVPMERDCADTDSVTAVPGHILSRFAANAPSGHQVCLRRVDPNLVLEDGAGEATIRLLQVPDPPLFGPVTAEAALSPSEVALVRRILFAAATSDSRPILKGVGLLGHHLTTSDDLMLARGTVEGELPEVVLPVGLFQQVARHSTIDATVIVGDSFVKIVHSGTEWWSSPIIGEYPNVDRLFTVNRPATLLASRVDLSRKLDRLAIFEGADIVVELSAGPDRLTMSIDDQELGSACEVLPVISSWSGAVTVTLRSLIEITDACVADTLRIDVGEARKPIRVACGDIEFLLGVRVARTVS